MDEAARKYLGEAGKRYLERFDKFDDQAIGKTWVEIGKREPELRVTTKNGLALKVLRSGFVRTSLGTMAHYFKS